MQASLVAALGPLGETGDVILCFAAAAGVLAPVAPSPLVPVLLLRTVVLGKNSASQSAG